MVRNYKKTPGRSYFHYTEHDLQRAISDVKEKHRSISESSRYYNIPRTTLRDRINDCHLKKSGGQPVLSESEEQTLKKYLLVLGDFGFPITTFDLRLIVKSFLDNLGRTEKRFQNNIPGRGWAYLFLRRHKDFVQRLCANIKRSRAKVNRQVISDYIDHLGETIPPGTPPENIYNYDETNLTDDPGNKRVLMKRGTKYPERIMNSSKSNTSVMFCGNAAGELLPPYVIYKSEHLWSSWLLGDPEGARYNRTKSGWFDMCCFCDWFERTALPILKKKNGTKVMIGDNLCSHFHPRIIQLCLENDILFVALPANSTHLAQPLDVAFFGPLKNEWSKILEEWKLKNGDKPLSKDVFPRLLQKLMTKVNMNGQALKSGFRKCGIYPISKEGIFKRMPPDVNLARILIDNANVDSSVSRSVLQFLHEQRLGNTEEQEKPQRRKKVQVVPGKSICAEDLENMETAQKRKAAGKNEKYLRKKSKKGESKVSKETSVKPKEKLEASEAFQEESDCDDPDILLMSDDETVHDTDEQTEAFCDIDIYPIGCYVIVNYEGEKFPGKVVNTDVDKTVEVSAAWQ